MSGSRVYLDTSAYLCVLLGEKGSAPLLKATRGQILCSSSLLLLESERNLIRLVREKKISQRIYEAAFGQLQKDVEHFVLRDFTLDLCLDRSFPPVRIPRSMDLAHLRTARWFQSNGGLSLFLSMDSAQSKAAAEFGLPVEAR